jgi:hypothetical protein
MMIETFTHGDDTTEDRLFSLIGRWLVSEDVIAKLGMPVTARAGDLWLVEIGTSGLPVGFTQMRLLKSSATAHVRYLHAADGLKRTKDALLAAVIASAKGKKMATVYTNDRETEPLWERHKFKKIPRKRGVFCRFELTMELKK